MPLLLPLLAAATAAGIVLADLRDLESRPALILALAALGAGLIVRHRPRLRAVAAVLASVGVGAHCLAWRIEQAQSARPRRAFDVTVEGTLCAFQPDVVWLVADLCRVVRVPGLAIDPLPNAPVPRRVRVLERRASAAADSLTSLRVGQRVRVRLRLRPPRSWGNPGSRDRVKALDRAGVGAVASVAAPGLGVRLPQRDVWRLAGVVGELRWHLSRRLAVAGPGAGLLRALAIGDRSGLTPSQREAFGRLGIAHLLAVSGLHLGLAAGLAFALLRPPLVRIRALAERADARLWALGGALVFALFYALLAGWGVPVRRSMVFLAALGLGLSFGRRRSPAHVLALAALVVLVSDPGALFDLGAQLSFLASAALLSAVPAPGQAAARSGLSRRLLSLLHTSASAVAITAPVMAFHGGPVTPLGLVGNLLAVPWTAIVLLPAALLAAAAAGVPASPASEWILTAAEGLGRLSLAAVERVAEASPVAVGGGRPAAWILAVASVLAVSAVRSRHGSRRLLLALSTVVLLRCGPVAFVPPAPPRIVGLDVGQGDSILIQGRRGALLVDGGRAVPGGLDLGQRVVLPALRALGVREVSLVVATHADLDHSGGLASVLASIPVGELWLPVGARGDVAFDRLLEIARDRGVRVREQAAGGEVVEVGDLRVAVLWPPAKATVTRLRNDRSLLLRVELAGVCTLLTGDLGVAVEEELLTSGVDLRADILKLGHHGSRSSSSPAFLRAVGAQVALLSAPCPGAGALPSGEVIQAVQQTPQALWWTGRDGAVLMALPRGGTPLTVWGWLSAPRCQTSFASKATRAVRPPLLRSPGPRRVARARRDTGRRGSSGCAGPMRASRPEKSP